MEDQQIVQKAMVEYSLWIDDKDPASLPLAVYFRKAVAMAVARKGVEDKNRFLDLTGKGELVITMRVRDMEDETEAIQHVFTFEQVKMSGFKLYQLTFEEMLAKMMTAPILKKVIES